MFALCTCCTNNCDLLHQKNISHRSTLRTKITRVTKKYVASTKKIIWHSKERLMLTKYVSCSAEKEIHVDKKIVPVVHKYMLY